MAFGTAAPTVRRAGLLKMKGAQTCQKRPRPQHLWAAFEAKRIGRICIYSVCNQIAMFYRAKEFFEQLAKSFQAPDTLQPGRGEATLRLNKSHTNRLGVDQNQHR